MRATETSPCPDGAAGELVLPLNLGLTPCFDLQHMPDAHREKISSVLGHGASNRDVGGGGGSVRKRGCEKQGRG